MTIKGIFLMALMVIMIVLMFYYSYMSFRENQTIEEILLKYCNCSSIKSLYISNLSTVVNINKSISK